MSTLIETSTEKNIPLSLGEKLIPAFIIAIHFSPAATTVISILLLITWLLSGKASSGFKFAIQSPAARYALILFIALAISVSYSSAPFATALSYLTKYRELLFLLILPVFLTSNRQRAICENTFIITLAVSLIISIFGHVGIISKELAVYMLKNHITHSLFIAFLGFYCLHKISGTDAYRPVWLLILAAAVIELFAINEGRTGQLAFLFLCGLYFLQVLSIRSALLLSLASILAFSWFLFESPYGAGFRKGIEESLAYFNNSRNLEHTSMGDRLRFWSSSLVMIQHYPWFGTGVGGISSSFHQLFPSDPIMTNPHNEYLAIATQIGIPGLAIFLAVFISIFQETFRLPKLSQRLTQGLLILLSISCIFNSSILDHTEGHWFISFITIFLAPILCRPSTEARE